ncbi:MAG: hypothetical protein KF799_08015 [Bdellovibrionales bacterium]|nr:hypothetical protein [Bdellovibrionales bacterium]
MKIKILALAAFSISAYLAVTAISSSSADLSKKGCKPPGCLSPGQKSAV